METMKLIETNKGLQIETRFGVEAIHVNHAHNSIVEFDEGIWSPYMVAEEATNFARVHLLTAPNEEKALQTIATYLFEEEDIEEPHLITAQKLTT